MTARARKPKVVTLKDAYETEFARREMERRKADEELRARQAKDEAGVEALYAALRADGKFLKGHGLTADRRGFQAMVDHERFRIAASFENGQATVTCSHRSAAGALSGPRQAVAEDVEGALRLIAQFLADEIR